MRVVGIQTDIAWEDPAENLRRAECSVAAAAAAGARLAVLPEMFATGFSMKAEAVAPHADLIREGVSRLARNHEIWLMAGFVEPGEGRPRNASVLYDPEGNEALRYHKIHPFSLAGEHECYDAGDAIVTHEVEGVRVTPFICYDLRFPEIFRDAAERTDLFCVIANWPSPRVAAWSTLLPARAIENIAYVLGVNRVGEGGGHHYSGGSALHDPLGETLASARLGATYVMGEVDAKVVAETRAKLGFLNDRRW